MPGSRLGDGDVERLRGRSVDAAIGGAAAVFETDGHLSDATDVWPGSEAELAGSVNGRWVKEQLVVVGGDDERKRLGELVGRGRALVDVCRPAGNARPGSGQQADVVDGAVLGVVADEGNQKPVDGSGGGIDDGDELARARLRNDTAGRENGLIA